MKIFPAIDIKDKKCVRLVRGDFNNKTEYQISPVDQAEKYKEHGFKNLHIVDLDGALTGETVNLEIIQKIRLSGQPVEQEGKFKGLPTIDELTLISMLSTTLKKNELVELTKRLGCEIKYKYILTKD